MNPTIQTGLKVTVIAGSSVLAVNAAVQIWKSGGEVKKWAMPAVTLLVAVSAFSYAMTTDITLTPKI